MIDHNKKHILTFQQFKATAVKQYPEHESMNRSEMRRWYKRYLKVRKDAIKDVENAHKRKEDL